MSKYELVFIPSPGISHMVSTVEMAKLLLERDQRLLITVFIMKFPNDTVTDDYTRRVSSNTTSRLRFTKLPVVEKRENAGPLFLIEYIDNQVAHVRELLSDLVKESSDSNSKLSGLVLDMFCTQFIDVGDEFDIPSYCFFTSGTCTLGMFNYLVSLKFEQNQDLTKFRDSDLELSIPCFSKHVPAKIVPAMFVQDGPMATSFLSYLKRLNKTKGIMINTFYELESFAIDALQADDSCRKVYPVGPILNSTNDQKRQVKEAEIIEWLDDQPESSVVFLCFGSMGSFVREQVKEIAEALERSEQRFLWSLRKPGEKGKSFVLPTEYEDFREVLPEGFLERTNEVGKLIDWAPQMTILSHKSVGCFVSHCGWNSVLEGLWFGVPIATFPLYAEQPQNAFLLVRELGIAEEIRIEYKRDLKGESPPDIVSSEDIERAIRRLMRWDEEESGVRRKVKEMKEKSRLALMEGGSSYKAQNLFIEDVIRNIG